MDNPALVFLFAFGLDLLMGDPRWFPHPVKFIGRFALFCEKAIRPALGGGRIVGLLVALLVITTTFAVTCSLLLVASSGKLLLFLASSFLFYTTIASRDLLKHAYDVYDALVLNDLEEARRRVGMIVGRDTSVLDEAEVSRAAVESVAENLVDGVTAPLLYGLVGGLLYGVPGVALGGMTFKAVNTLDSTFGYKNERYFYFGWASARIDDLAGFLPSRITPLVMCVAAFLCKENPGNCWRIWRRDRTNHSSPNAGNPEAAMAGALNVQLGGDNIYFGKVVSKPTMGEADFPLTADTIVRANRMQYITSLIMLSVCAIVSAVSSMYNQ